MKGITLANQATETGLDCTFVLTLRNRMHRVLYQVSLFKDEGKEWRVLSIEHRAKRLDWLPEIGRNALDAGILPDSEKPQWLNALMQGAATPGNLQTSYQRLLRENVRAVVTDRNGNRVPAPQVDNFVSIEFRPNLRGQRFTAKSIIDRLTIDTRDVTRR